jgi:hypothetical protein
MVDKSFWDAHSNSTSEWYTPIDEIFQPLNEEFHFETDISAESTNRLGCKNFITKDMVALRNRHLRQAAVNCSTKSDNIGRPRTEEMD